MEEAGTQKDALASRLRRPSRDSYLRPPHSLLYHLTPLASRPRNCYISKHQTHPAPAGLSSSREMVEAPAVVVVRAYDDDDARDRAGVEEVERACEVRCMSGGGKMCLFTDLLGDPLCRIRHSPDSLMLVRIHDHVRAARSLCLLCLYTHVVVVPGWGLRAGCG